MNGEQPGKGGGTGKLDYTPRKKRPPSADVERELLAAAEAVLVREGPAGLTVRAVAAEAGIAPMGVYSRLGGKEGLVDALLIRGFDRLRATVESADRPSRTRCGGCVGCAHRYRQFALANPHFYAIMFENAIPRDHMSDVVMEHAAATFGALERSVEFAAAAAGRIIAPDATEVAQQLWNGVHGAVALELKGMILTSDPAATYEAFVLTVLRGLAVPDR